MWYMYTNWGIWQVEFRLSAVNIEIVQVIWLDPNMASQCVIVLSDVSQSIQKQGFQTIYDVAFML